MLSRPLFARASRFSRFFSVSSSAARRSLKAPLLCSNRANSNAISATFHRSLSTQVDGEVKAAEEIIPAEVVEAPLAKSNEQTLSFQAETRQILDIMANALYTDKEVFLREIISNASDALEKARYVQTNNQTLIDPDRPLEVRITADEAKNLLIIEDSGIGMTGEELKTNLGTIAKSGSKQFMKDIKQKGGAGNSNIIGQFGVGFYSTFMVSNHVEVYSQSAASENDKSHYWSSDGTGTYNIAEIARQPRGSKIVIHLKPECKEFASAHSVENIIKKYSNFVGFPIYFNGERLNTMGALWLQSKDSVTEEQHQEFYKYYCHAYDSPLYRLHFSVDAPIEIHALFYFPERHMEKYGMGRMEPGVSLYSRKVLIKPKSKEVLPEWMRFIKGVVDSEDIPLNISRESMQDSRLIAKINTVLSRKLIKFMIDEAKNNSEKYKTFFDEFGQFIKEGILTDFANRSEIAKLLRFESSIESGKQFSFDDYISRMPPEQKNIYYLSAPNRESALASPYYEQFKSNGTEVFFLYSPIDDFCLKNLNEFNGRKFASVEESEAKQENNKPKEEQTEEQKSTMQFIESTLGDRVSSVVATDSLVDFPAVVRDHESAAFRKMMRSIEAAGGDSKPLPKQKLEVNLKHPIIIHIGEVSKLNPTLAASVTEQLFDNALLAADLLDNPRTMLGRINKIMMAALEKK